MIQTSFHVFLDFVFFQNHEYIKFKIYYIQQSTGGHINFMNKAIKLTKRNKKILLI